jgi:hypothetical protein
VNVSTSTPITGSTKKMKNNVMMIGSPRQIST